MKALSAIKSFILQYKVLAILYVLITIIGIAQIIGFGHVNNFAIFRGSSHHMLQKLPLYVEYPKEYFDLFYYNPTFPMLFLPFALLPAKLGIITWMTFTMALAFVTYKALPLDDQQKKIFILLMAFDLLNNITHTQTNPIFLSFMLLTWVFMERDKPVWAALFAVLSFLIKGYGGIIGVLCLFYKSWYKVVLYSIAWLIALHGLLLLFISPQLMMQYYTDWLHIISSDTIKESCSVYGVVTNLHLAIPERYILATAGIIMAAYLGMQIFLKQRNREHIIAFLLIWVIVFNRASEPATYIIAIAGVIIWYLARPKTLFSTTLFWITILSASIIPTDISAFFDKLRYEYYLKSILCMFVLLDIVVFTAKRLTLPTPPKNAARI